MTEPNKMDASMSNASAATSPPKRDKFASMAAAAAAASPLSQQEPPVASTKANNEILKQRMEQRRKVLQDLQQAEGWTWNLLTLASKTAHSLSTLDMTDATKEQVSQLSKKYRDTLQNIHSILTPHASLVVAYENHDIDKNNEEKKEGAEDKKEVVNMYAARVEMRLAQESRHVLKELLKLEQQEKKPEAHDVQAPTSTAPDGKKRKRRS